MHFCDVAQQKLSLPVTLLAALPLTYYVVSDTWGSVQLWNCCMFLHVIYGFGEVVELFFFILAPLPLVDRMLELSFPV